MRRPGAPACLPVTSPPPLYLSQRPQRGYMILCQLGGGEVENAQTWCPCGKTLTQSSQPLTT